MKNFNFANFFLTRSRLHYDLANTISMFCILLILAHSANGQYDSENQKHFLDNASSDSVSDVINFLKGDVPDFYPTEILASIRENYPEKSSDETIYVLPYMRNNLISSGDDYKRVHLISSKLIKFMRLDGRLSLVYYKSEIPITGFIYPNTLFISSSAESILSDSEIEALLAHELCHLIIHEEFKKHAENRDYKEMRLLELFADAVAITIIEGKKGSGSSESLIKGLKKMQARVTFVTGEIEDGLKHPTLKTREKLLGKLQQNFSKALAKALN